MEKTGRIRVSYQDIINKAFEIFGDKDKTLKWYMEPCETFNNKSPFEYAKSGHHEKVMKVLDGILYTRYKR